MIWIYLFRLLGDTFELWLVIVGVDGVAVAAIFRVVIVIMQVISHSRFIRTIIVMLFSRFTRLLTLLLQWATLIVVIWWHLQFALRIILLTGVLVVLYQTILIFMSHCALLLELQLFLVLLLLVLLHYSLLFLFILNFWFFQIDICLARFTLFIGLDHALNCIKLLKFVAFGQYFVDDCHLKDVGIQLVRLKLLLLNLHKLLLFLVFNLIINAILNLMITLLYTIVISNWLIIMILCFISPILFLDNHLVVAHQDGLTAA